MGGHNNPPTGKARAGSGMQDLHTEFLKKASCSAVDNFLKAKREEAKGK